MRSISATELAEHKTRKSCWLAVHGKVYDVTEFLDNHPGGASLLLKSSGRDATSAYESIHNPELINETLAKESCLGQVDLATLDSHNPEEILEETEPDSEYPALSSIINVDDFEAVAKKYLVDISHVCYPEPTMDPQRGVQMRTSFHSI